MRLLAYLLLAACGRIDFDPVVAGERHLALGANYSCLVDDAGDVRCWGNGVRGKLGFGNVASIGDDELPGAIVPLGGAASAIAAGKDHTCALMVGGTVRCWGVGDNGELGYGSVADIGDDEAAGANGDVALGGTAVQVVAGGEQSCARLDDGSVRCFGLANGGRLGYGNTIAIGDDELPDSAGAVPLGGAAIQIATRGSHSCALLDTGGVRCWGNASNGELGYGDTANIGDDEPAEAAGDVEIGGRVVEIAVGASHNCARLDTGAVRCWGEGTNGRLGYANTANIGDDELPSAAGDVPLGGAAIAISAGGSHTCALLAGGGVRCWGQGVNGQLGYGRIDDVGDDETPASVGDVPLGAAAVEIYAGGQHTCARLVTGGLRCWGENTDGQLGYGNVTAIGDDETPETAGDVPL